MDLFGRHEAEDAYIWTLREVGEGVKDALYEGLPERMWIRAEILEMSVRRHAYLTLVEHEKGQIVAEMRACVWESVFRRIGLQFVGVTGENLKAGMEVLLLARVEMHERYGLSLIVEDIDPTYTAGAMAANRRAILRKLEAVGAMDMNKSLTLADVPLRIAVVSSRQAAGYEDFADQLKRSGYAFDVRLYEAMMQGEKTEETVVKALERIVERVADYDVVCLIRGGGGSGDLSAFDNYEIAYHCAQFPLPVIAGIGHTRDRSVVDEVVWGSLKTPTAVADMLIERVAEQAERMREVWRKGLSLVSERIVRERHAVALEKETLGAAAKACVARERDRIGRLREHAVHDAEKRVAVERINLQAWVHKTDNLDPERHWRAGYARIRRGTAWLRSAETVGVGDEIDIEWGDGSVRAMVVKKV